MARYIDADALIKHYIALVKMDWNNKVSPPSWSYAYESFIDYIAELPTADVVPKSEVEKLLDEIMDYLSYSDDDVIAEGKYRTIDLDEVANKFDELKKKYTEGKTNAEIH